MDPVAARAYAFDPMGRMMAGWPLETEIPVADRMVGDDLWLMVEPPNGDESAPASIHMVRIRADGTLDQGVATTVDSGDDAFAIGPDGVGYHARHYGWSRSDLADVTSEVAAFDLTGMRSGWPATIKGNASTFAFDASGLVYLVVGSPSTRPARTVVLDKNGRVLPNGSAAMPVTSSATWDGAGGEVPGPPIVADDGRAYIVDTQGGHTRVVGLSPGGDPLTGWPYTSSIGMGWTGFCGEGDTGCGHVRTMPAVGKGGFLYLVRAPSSRSTGGSLVVIGPDGKVRSGWPVGLKRAGSMFWSLTVDPRGGVWALAIEPERKGASATILSIAEDSTIRWGTTILQP